MESYGICSFVSDIFCSILFLSYIDRTACIDIFFWLQLGNIYGRATVRLYVRWLMNGGSAGGWFPVRGYYDKASMNTSIQDFMWICFQFSCVNKHLGIELPGCMLNCVRTYHAFSRNDCTILHSWHQCTSVLVLHSRIVTWYCHLF